MKIKHLIVPLTVLLTGAFLQTEVAGADETASESFKWGGDLRLRTTQFKHVPTSSGGEVRGGEASFQRYRTRLWGEYQMSDALSFRTRLTNEFRTQQEPSGSHGWEAMDELVFDNLYLDYKSDDLNVRLGRQDMIYGTGKVMLDGTPLDGSRTIYFNAAKATYKGIEDTTVDFFYVYTPAEDDLALNSQHRCLNGTYTGGYDGAEAGVGIYVKNKSLAKMPWEAYVIMKTEEEGMDQDLTTYGFRLMPKSGDGSLSANLEVAGQSSSSASGYMIDASVKFAIKSLEEKKATLAAGYYSLSGDDSDTAFEDEGWNPVFSRWPQYSEGLLYSFGPAEGIARWSNVSMPHLDLSITPSENWKSDLVFAWMDAHEIDGPGTGDSKGTLITWWNRFTLKKGLLTETDKVTAHVVLELFEPGDYYTKAQQNQNATFVRVELSYGF